MSDQQGPIRPPRQRKADMRPERNKGLELLLGLIIAGFADVAVFYLVVFGSYFGAYLPAGIVPYTTAITLGVVFCLIVFSAWGSIRLLRKGYPELGVSLLAVFVAPIVGFSLLLGTCLMTLK